MINKEDIALEIHGAICEYGWDDCVEEHGYCFRAARAVIEFLEKKQK